MIPQTAAEHFHHFKERHSQMKILIHFLTSRGNKYNTQDQNSDSSNENPLEKAACTSSIQLAEEVPK